MIIKLPADFQIPHLRRLWKEAFGDGDGFLDDFFASGFSPERCLTLWQEEDLAAALYWFDCICHGQKAAYVYAVATAQAYRGQGLCHTLMKELHAQLLRDGYAMAILVPGSDSLYRFYSKMGYLRFGGIKEFTCAAGDAVPLRQLSAEEYATLRRQYLPKGGVLQEGANLTFLRTQTAFYAGEDFLLCATAAEGRLFAPELLGNAEAAGGITTSLGCTEGRFRTPGEEPFAMYKSFVTCEKPEYFAFAFD